LSTASEIAPGLHRWTAWHDHWAEDVACLAVETADGLVLIDPLDPPRAFKKPKHVLITVFWHARSTPGLGSPHVWSSRANSRTLGSRGVAVTDPIENGGALPGGIESIPTARRGEVVYWLPGQRAVVAGDVLLGAGAKPRATDDPLRLCPEGWLGKANHADLRESLRPLLDRPVQRVLPSHGQPVLRAGKRHLEALLA
jgi:glyoxylase-like metal-dependent hydrolase (beta-lactamase superfamily II)